MTYKPVVNALADKNIFWYQYFLFSMVNRSDVRPYLLLSAPLHGAWDIAFQVYDLRKKAGLTQAQLAKLVDTKQSNIARLESADYTAYTFKTLQKITKALKARLEIRIVPKTNSKSASL